MLWVGRVLARRHLDVVQPTELVRSAHHLEAAVLGVRPVERDHDRQHLRFEAAVVVPIAVILMPFPGAADSRLLGRQLRLKMVDRLADQRLRGVHDAFRTRGKPVNAVPGPVPQRDARRAAFLVRPQERMVADGGILLHGAPEEIGLPVVEKLADEHETVLMILRDLGGRQARWHG
jgi:hypothetical protein